MDALDLNLGDIKLQIRLIGRTTEAAGKPYLDWLHCAVQVFAPSFVGSVRWNVMPQELATLADDLSSLYDAFPNRDSVTFQPTEPNIALHFNITTTGAISGRGAFRDDFAEGDVLECRFHIDQSYLPELARNIRAFLKTVEPAA
jgi:hypothetical protein